MAVLVLQIPSIRYSLCFKGRAHYIFSRSRPDCFHCGHQILSGWQVIGSIENHKGYKKGNVGYCECK